MESMLYWGHRFLGGIKHFSVAVRVSKMNLVLEDLARQKWTKIWPKWGLSWGLIDVWQNDWYYCGVLERLRKRVHHVWPEIADTWMLHHNTPCHTAISVNEFLTKKGIPVFPHSPYSLDLSPCDFFLFPKFKFHLRGCHFGTVDNIQKVVTDQLRALPHEDFQHCYRQWEQRLRRCVASEGNYFEGDRVDS